MLAIQQQLIERFSALRDSRTGPVYFIEHGLCASELDDIVASVRIAAETHALDDMWWDSRRLPLIVVATEVGYRYRGNGTDFWPLLESELQRQTTIGARQRIRDYFAAATEEFRGVRPPVTAWAQAFHLISWPIAHALVPLEFHLPLALTLANLRVNTTDLDNVALARAIRLAAASPSARFATLLEDTSLVAVVARNLLGEANSEICPEIMQRIDEDLSRDRTARRSVESARRTQRATPKAQPRTKNREKISNISGTLQLRRREDNLSLEASFPPLPDDVQLSLRRTLRRQRYAPSLWGATARVPGDQLVSGFPFTVVLEGSPPDGADLMPGLSSLEIELPLRNILSSFVLEFAPPLVFTVGADQDVARQIHGPAISGYRQYWALATPETLPKGLPKIGDVGPYACVALDPQNDSTHREALSNLGFTIRLGVSVAFAGAPKLNIESSMSSYVVGDLLVASARVPYLDGILVEINGNSTRANCDEVVCLSVQEGEHLLRVSSGGEFREYAFRGVSQPSALLSPAISITAQTTDLSIQAMIAGALSFRIESAAGFGGMALTIELVVGGQRKYASAPLEQLPQLVSSVHEPFLTLLDEETCEWLLRAPSATVCIRVGRIHAQSWVLEHRVRPCWWENGPNDSITLTNCSKIVQTIYEA